MASAASRDWSFHPRVHHHVNLERIRSQLARLPSPDVLVGREARAQERRVEHLPVRGPNRLVDRPLIG